MKGQMTATETFKQQEKLAADAVDRSIGGYKGVITKKETKIKELQASLEKIPTLKDRFLSRKFLLSAIPLVFTLIGATMVFFGYKLTPEQNQSLSVISTTVVSLVALFAVPEALTDYKIRMVNAGEDSSKKTDSSTESK